MAAPVMELRAIEGRVAALLARHPQLDDAQAYAMAAASLSDWQVRRALEYMRAGMFFTSAVYEASWDKEPPPPVAPRHITPQCARRDLTTALCYYSLIRYIGSKGKDMPVVGVVVICPGRDYRKVQYNLAPCRKLVPRSKRWRKVEEWLRIEAERPPDTLEALERDRCDLVTQHTPWRRWLRMEPIQTLIAAPRMILNTLYEEKVMGKAMTTMTDAEIEAELEEEIRHEEAIRELEFTPEEPDDHYMITKQLPLMDLMEVRYWMKRLRQSGGRHAQADKEKLYDRLLFILTIEKPGLASVVKGIMRDAEQVRG